MNFNVKFVSINNFLSVINNFITDHFVLLGHDKTGGIFRFYLLLKHLNQL